VLLVDGFTWTRYRVAFDNGYDLGSIDGSHLSRPKEFDAALAQRAAGPGTAVAETTGDSDGAVAEAAGESKTVNGVSVPGHLLERSLRARERLSA
jgi:hypothetical protein